MTKPNRCHAIVFAMTPRAHEIEVPLRVELFDFGVMLWRHGVTGKHCSEWRPHRLFPRARERGCRTISDTEIRLHV
jgi:hypothetical protein